MPDTLLSQENTKGAATPSLKARSVPHSLVRQECSGLKTLGEGEQTPFMQAEVTER